MSESDKKSLDDDFDWDSALAEWDKQPFSPEVAAEKREKEKAAAEGKPLYRPPAKTVDPSSAQIGAPVKPPPPPPPPPAAEPPRKRGGLGHLFSRPEARKAMPGESVDVFLDAPVMARKPPVPAPPPEEPPVAPVTGDIEDALQAAVDAPSESLDELLLLKPASSAPELVVEAPSPAEPLAPVQPAPLPEPEQPRHVSVSSEVEEVHEFEAPKLPSIAPPVVADIEDERPAASWLDEETIASLRERAVWLETEARNVPDKVGSAKMLLSVSELRAIVGDFDEARQLADEALALAPYAPLAYRQVRTLVPRDASVVQALDAELRHTTAPAPKLHAHLYAAQALATSGDADGASKRYDAAARIAPNDATVVLARALRAIVQGELTNAALKVPDSPSLAPLATALAAALRARGAISRDPDTGGGGALDILERARSSLERGDVAGAVDRLGELAATQPSEAGSEPVLARGARWIASAFAAVRAPTRRKAVELLEALAKGGDELAPRALAARAVELGDAEVGARAIAAGGSFAPADRVALAALLGFKNDRDEHDIAALMGDDGGTALAAACARKDDPDYRERTAGSPASRSAVRIGRLLAAGTSDLEAAADAAESHAGAFARALRIESARLAERHEEVVAALASWGAGDAQRSLAAALVAERARLGERAAASYRAAFESDPSSEAAARAAAALDETASLPASLTALAAHATDPIRAALLELEAFLRAPREDATADLAALERIHKHAPQLPFATFLAQRIARRAGDEAAVVHWLHERQKAVTDPLERALDLVREAWLIADGDATGASERLDEAHRLRPDDIALRELHERLSPEPLVDRATWREQRAATAKGISRDLMFIEAAYEHERAGDPAAALAAAKAADRGGEGPRLARISLERAELLAGDAARLADELLAAARSAETVDDRREAYERLADLDATARNDPASALLWHRTILEETPRHKPSLQHVQHALVTDRRDEELEPVLAAVAHALDQTTGGECDAQAQVAARFRMRAGDWDGTREYAELGAKQPAPTMWALRLRNAHARAAGDDALMLEATLPLLERATRPIEVATLSLRAAEAALRKGDLELAHGLAERATTADPADVAAWKALASIRQQRGDAPGAAEAYESLARTASVDSHRLAAWYAAGAAHTDEARALAAFEQAASIDVTYEDIFHRLSKLYAQRGMRGELAALLQRRISTVLDPEERLALEVDRGRALAEAEDFDAAREAYEAALALQPDHVGALTAMGELSMARKDWEAAEQVWVRLARLLATPEEQLTAYRRLGNLYATHLGNMSRAEVAYREVLKRAPDDVDVRERLVEVYKKQNDAPHALEIQQELLANAQDPDTKRKRLIGLSAIHETASRDLRKAEQTLEGARREFPSDVGVLRALAEFYIRHKQTPAVNILLDRAAGDARRAFAAGRFSAPLFETMVAVYELRGKQDAARVVAATLAAWSGEPSALTGAEGRAFDARLDDLLAPDMMGPPARTLLARTGHALDVATALDPRGLGAMPMLQGEPLARLAASMAQSANIGAGVQILVSPQLGHQCVASGDLRQPALIVGADFSQLPELPRSFLMMRAFKLMQVRGSAFSRAEPAEVPVIVAAWLRAYAPSYAPPGIPPQALAEATRRIQGALPRAEPDLGLAALEVAGAIGPQLGLLAGSVLAWANHTALLGIGDLGAALDGLAYGTGSQGGEPPPAAERGAWVSRTPEAKELVAFSVSDGYTEARIRLGIR